MAATSGGDGGERSSHATTPWGKQQKDGGEPQCPSEDGILGQKGVVVMAAKGLLKFDLVQ